ncbi:hypothetical protein [Deinococcus gobiensis]|uniref:Uncharacterized protein n=1 Tax=Deinococcus gobiensis (strain DSM 21396 / JCM 16679 / CGMCC 1.7299 / I-0) TaxID=745776 RepID=H8H2T1_DEIGI|nr:hypothetical protein [Deinococcus gobiensis]AFD27828.1 hypothetical protein DGo_PC0036 [Deinococcus gobiensis I-0]
MNAKKARLSYEAIKEIARKEFIKALPEYDCSDFAVKMQNGEIRGGIAVDTADRTVQYGVYEARESDADPLVEYGRIVINPYTGDCLSVEILSMTKL